MKRIIAVMATLMFAAILFNINVSATSTYSYSRQYVELLGEYKNGNITLDEFNEAYSSLSDEWASDNTSSQRLKDLINVLTFDLNDIIELYGENKAKSVIDDVLNPYESTQTVPTVSTNGYGAKLYVEYYDGIKHEFYCDYILLDNQGQYWACGKGVFNYYAKPGSTTVQDYTQTFTNGHSTSYFKSNNWYVSYAYGDVRYSDGTQAPTNDNYVDMPVYDFSNATDSEIDELLVELNETLKRENPDLSTMEGLLESIYYRLGRLDSDDDNGLLNDINLAILALSNSNDENAAAIIASLAEIRDEIKNMSGDINDNLDDLENNFDKIVDYDIPDELLNVDFDSLSDELKDKIDDIVELVTTLVAKGVPMAAINGGLLFYQDIIFYSHEPQDIVFDLTFNGEQYNFTILSTSFFGSEGAQALQIIKNFVSIVLGYAWVLAMRKKAVNMMN